MAKFKRKQYMSPKKCAAKSFRMKRLKGGKLLRICCPKGRWDAKKGLCKVGTKAQALLTPRMGGIIKSIRIIEDKP